MPLVAALVLTVLFSAPSPEAIQRAVAGVEEDPGLQTERFHPEPEPRRPTEPPPDLGGLAVLLKALLYTGLAVLVVLVAVAVFRAVRDRSVAAAPRAPPVAPTEDEADLDLKEPLDEASALAAQERYAEAAHALLLKTLGVLAHDENLPRSWTSREILARLELAPAAHEALEALVLTTELSLFGGRAVDAEGYRRCLDAFHRVREAVGA